jgi:hypothetical protein
VQVVDDRGAAKVEQVLALAQVAGAAALPVADLGQGVLDRDAFAQPGPPLRGELALAELGQQPLVGVVWTLRPRALVVHWVRSGQAWQTAAGNWTLPAGVNAISWPAGHTSCPRSKSSVKSVLANRGPLRTRHALQKTARSPGRSRTSTLAR